MSVQPSGPFAPARGAARAPLKFYRLWCGRKRYTCWLPDIDDVFEVAIANGLAFRAVNGGAAGFGPLTWIEGGERARPRAKTISLGRIKG